MPDDDKLVMCFNRGCGKLFDPSNNPNDACRYHSGEPFFHDAYKGWSCCNKKCTDFTEFLNFPGCTVSKHSNDKPPEIIKVPVDNLDEIIEVKPISSSTLVRPPINTPMVTLTPELAPTLKQQQIVAMPVSLKPRDKVDENVVTVGMSCKHGGCTQSYEGPDSDIEVCVHHPGYPVFHEGMKFWSCCTKRTSDFNAFLNQKGCERGNHLWFKQNQTETVDCRWDWHQTGNFVVLTVYAKQYCTTQSTVQLNPIRANVTLVFPQENNSFNLDFELFRVIDVSKSSAHMFGSKVEIKLRKAEPGSWSKLNVPIKMKTGQTPKIEEDAKVDALAPQVDAVDLSDL